MMTLALLAVMWTANDPTWSNEVAVLHGHEAVVRYQARMQDGYVFVKATHNKGWHTFAMDNELRALHALQGKPSLGIEQGIEIRVEGGLKLDGPWLQTKPKDFSKPEIRWFSYGFEQTALFACRVKEVTANDVTLRIRGQACSGETCCRVDIALTLQGVDRPVGTQTPQGLSMKTMFEGLVPVETRDEQASKEAKS